MSEGAKQPYTASLEEHEVRLAEVQMTDFRSLNLFRMLTRRLTPGTVIDVGCGAGGMVAYLLEHGFDACGIDLSDPVIAAARRFLAGHGLDPSRVTVSAIETLVAQGRTFDNVLCMDCIEHVQDDRGFVEYLTQVVAPGGRLLLTVPALQWLYGPRDLAQGHYRRYHRAMLAKLFAPTGVVIEELRYWNALGVLPTFVTHKLLRRGINESFRFATPTWRARALRYTLDVWFRSAERYMRPPLGLTLMLVARRSP